MLDNLSRRDPSSDTAAENIRHGGANEELLECTLAAPGVDGVRPFGDALSALALEGWQRWWGRFPRIEETRPQWRGAGGPSGDPGAGGLGRRALATPGDDGGRPFGDRVQCRRPGSLAAWGSRFPGIEAARPRWPGAGGPSGDPGAGWLDRRALTAPGDDGGRPFGDRVQCRRPGSLASWGSRFLGIEAARPRWRGAGGPSGVLGAGGLGRRALVAPVTIERPRAHSTHLQSPRGSRSFCH